MITDSPPRTGRLRAEFFKSDELDVLEVPDDDRLRSPAKAIKGALNSSQRAAVRKACTEFVNVAADFYGVGRP